MKLRLTAMAMTFLQAACLLGSLVAIVAWPQILRVLGLDPHGAVAWVATAVRWSAVFLMVLLSFALTFHVGPNAPASLGMGHAGKPCGNHRLPGLLHPVPPLRPELRQLQQSLGALGGVMVLLFWFWAVALVLLARPKWTGRSRSGSAIGRPAGR